MAVDLAGYLDGLAKRYSAYYDVERGKKLGDRTLDLFACSKIRNEKYFITKTIPIYGYENYHYGLVSAQEGILGRDEVEDFAAYLKGLVATLVTPHHEHMSSCLDGVLVAAGGFTREAIAAAEGFKYSRMFKFGFAGWCDVRLFLVDLAAGQVFSNRKGRDMQKYYLPQEVIPELR